MRDLEGLVLTPESESMNLTVDVIRFQDHNTGEYTDKIKGQRVVRLIDECGEERGELVWRLASGHTIEICEMEITRGEDHGQGLGTRLLEESIKDMQAFFSMNQNYEGPLRRIFLFTEASNDYARVFYKARGFSEEAVLQDFYDDGDAVLCILNLQ